MFHKGLRTALGWVFAGVGLSVPMAKGSSVSYNYSLNGTTTFESALAPNGWEDANGNQTRGDALLHPRGAAVEWHLNLKKSSATDTRTVANEDLNIPDSSDPTVIAPYCYSKNWGENRDSTAALTPATIPVPASAGMEFSMLAGFGGLAALRKRFTRKPRIV